MLHQSLARDIKELGRGNEAVTRQNSAEIYRSSREPHLHHPTRCSAPYDGGFRHSHARLIGGDGGGGGEVFPFSISFLLPTAASSPPLLPLQQPQPQPQQQQLQQLQQLLPPQ